MTFLKCLYKVVLLEYLGWMETTLQVCTKTIICSTWASHACLTCYPCIIWRFWELNDHVVFKVETTTLQRHYFYKSSKMTQKTSYPMLYYYNFELFKLWKKATWIKDRRPCDTFELKRWRCHYHTLCVLVLFCRLSIHLNNSGCNLGPFWAIYSLIVWNFLLICWMP